MDDVAQAERAFWDLLAAVRWARVELDVPLRAGRFRFPGPRATEPQVKIDPGTRLQATLELARTAPGQMTVLTSELRFSPMIAVTNPVRAFARPKSFFHRIAYTLADWFIDVGVSRLYFDGEGRLSIDGAIAKLWPFGYSPLRVPEAQRAALPKIKRVLALPPARGAITRGVAAPAPPAPVFTPDLELLLRRIGAASEKGSVCVEVETDAIDLADRRYVSVAAGIEPASLRLDGTIDIDDRGVVRFAIDDARPAELETSLATISLSGEAKGEIHERTLHVDARAHTRVKPAESVLTITPAPGAVFPVTLDRPFEANATAKILLSHWVPAIPEARGDVALEARIAPQHQVELNHLVIALADAKLSAKASASFSIVDGVGRVSDATVDVSLMTDDPSIAYRDTRIEIDGGVSVHVDATDASFDGATRKGSVRGALAIDFTPDPKTLQRMPELARLHGRLEFAAVVGARTLDLDLGEGLIGLLDPIFELRGRPDSIVPATGPAVGPVGSDAMRRRVTELTGAELTEGNRVTLLIDGVMSYPRRLALIDGARESISVQTLIFRDDESGNETARRLVAAAKRGVKVRVIIDALGNVRRLRDVTEGTGIYKLLREGGVDLRLYNHPAQTALAELIPEIVAIPGLGGADSPDDLSPLRNPALILKLFTRLVRVAKGRTAAPDEIKRRVGAKLGRMLDVTQHLARRGAHTYDTPEGERALDLVDIIHSLRQVAGLNHRWHEKYLIVDGRDAILGGMNIADEYMFGGTDRVITVLGRTRPVWRDTDVEIHGPAAAEAYSEFADNWHTLTGETMPAPVAAPPVPGGVPIQVVQHRPREDGTHPILNVFLENLKALGPGDKAWFDNAYFLPLGSLIHLKIAMKDAARRGVDVRVVTNSATTTDLPEINYAAIYTYRELIPAGVRIFERTGTRTVHNKVAVLGGNTTIIGSWNADNRSEGLNSEVVAVIYDEALAKQVEQMFLADSAEDVARELGPRDVVTQPFDDELRSLGLAALGDLL